MGDRRMLRLAVSAAALHLADLSSFNRQLAASPGACFRASGESLGSRSRLRLLPEKVDYSTP